MVGGRPDEISKLVLASFAIKIYRSISFFLFINGDNGGSDGKRLTQFSSSRWQYFTEGKILSDLANSRLPRNRESYFASGTDVHATFSHFMTIDRTNASLAKRHTVRSSNFSLSLLFLWLQPYFISMQPWGGRPLTFNGRLMRHRILHFNGFYECVRRRSGNISHDV